MSSEPRAFAAIDQGTATVAVSLIGRFDGRWRLLGSTAGPAAVPADALLERLRSRLAAADPDLAARALAREPRIRGRPAAGEPRPRPHPPRWPSSPPRGAPSRRSSPPRPPPAGASAARRSTAPRSSPSPGCLADPAVTAVLAGSGEPPGGDERPLVPDLKAIVEAAAQRRPELTAAPRGWAGRAGWPHGGRASRRTAAARRSPRRPRPRVAAPRCARCSITSGPARATAGARIAAATATLADVLDRRIEVIEIGQSAGARVSAAPHHGPRRAATAPPGRATPRSR